ncbi:MAG: MFS transporter [Bacteroidales bacterium]|nr:MFS transporter [Bacteroidales bacterium]MDD4603248.1 MFS transporter [Bacteroidales bacterium]
MMKNTAANGMSKSYPIFMAFLCMGFGDVVGPMVGLAKESFQLSNFMAQLLPLMGFIMFGILSVPMGVLQGHRGKKFLLILGLIIAFIGLLIPIINGMYGPVIAFNLSSGGEFYILLFSILMLGAGATILQVSGNPIMRDVSPEGKFSSNLSMGQSIKAIGSSMGFLLPPLVAKPLGLDWTILFPIYAILILITLVWVYFTKIEEKRDPDSKPVSLIACLKLLGNGYVALMVAAIFVYVGAEVSMSSGIPILLKEKYGIENFGLLVAWTLFFLPILVGRFTGALILRSLSPKKFLIATVILSFLGILMMFLGSKFFAYTGIILVGLGFANIFPLIFSITVDRMPERSNELSGLMVSAIVGGALIPPIMGLVADNTTLLTGFIVPLVCVTYIGYCAISTFRKA